VAGTLQAQPRASWLRMCTGGVALLAPLLRNAGAPAANQQVLYDAGLGVWQLTFYRPAAEIMRTTGARARISTKSAVLQLPAQRSFALGTARVDHVGMHCCMPSKVD